MKLPSIKQQGGFTIIELMVITPMMMLVAFSILSMMISIYGQSIVGTAEVNLQLQAETVLTTMQDELIFADSFGETISSDSLNLVADPNQPGGGWNFNTSPHSTLIVIEPALTANRQNPAADFVRRNYFGCSQALESNPRVFNNLVYFVSGSSLYKRILPAGSSGTLCSQTYRVRTCPTALVTPTCPNDITLSNTVESFVITYYDEANQVIDIADGGSPTDAEKITMQLDLTDQINGKTITASAGITVRNLN